MRVPDTVEGVQDPYLNEFQLWGAMGRRFETGSQVPSVGMADTYAVQFVGPENAGPMFLWVQDNRITNVMALQPIGQRSVFDQRGSYLGRGGFDLDPIVVKKQEHVDIVTAIKQSQAPEPEKVEETKVSNLEEDKVSDLVEALRNVPMPEGPMAITDLVEEEAEQDDDTEVIDEMLAELEEERAPDPAPLLHVFHLRPDFKLQIPLPMDLTEHEAERLATFLLSLPFHRDA